MSERPIPNWLRRAAITMTVVGAIGFGVSGVDMGINGVKVIKEVMESSDEELAKPSETIDLYNERVIRDFGALTAFGSLIAGGATVLYTSARGNRRKQEETEKQQPSVT